MAHAEVHRRQPTIPKASSAYFMRPHVSCLACLDAAGSEYYNSLCTALRCGTCAIGRCPSGVHLAIGLHFRGLVLQKYFSLLGSSWTLCGHTSWIWERLDAVMPLLQCRCRSAIHAETLASSIATGCATCGLRCQNGTSCLHH